MPSWTDRVLWSGVAASGVTVVAYVSCQRVLCSDHKPVVALLRFQPPEADSASPVEGLAAGGAARQGCAASMATGPVITDSLIDFGDLAAPTPCTPAAAADAATLLLQPPAAVPPAAPPPAAVDLLSSPAALLGDLFDAPPPPPQQQPPQPPPQPPQPQLPPQPQPPLPSQPRAAAVLPLGGAPTADTPPVDAGATALFPPSELFGAGGGDCGGGGGAFGSADGKRACASASASADLFDAIGTAVAALGGGASGSGACGNGGCGSRVCSDGACGGASGGSLDGAFGGMGSVAGVAAAGGVAGGWGACPAMATPMQCAPAGKVAPAPATQLGSPAPAPALADAFSGLGVGDLMSASKTK